MTGTFPLPDAALDATTFEQCYALISQAIADETPTSVADPFRRMPDYQDVVGETRAPLDKWRAHALDGDPSQLPHQSGTPWGDLETARIGHLADLIEVLSRIGDSLTADWKGSAADTYAGYMGQISGRLDAYAGKDNSLVRQAELVLNDAFAIRAAFKKDLLELARGAYDKLKSIDDGVSAGDIGMLCLLLVSVGFGEVSAAAGTVTTTIFTKAVNSFKDYAFATSKTKVFLHGDLPKDIMKSFDAALDQIVEAHRTTAKAATARMGDLWDRLATSADEQYYPEIPVLDLSNTPSFNQKFFPR